MELWFAWCGAWDDLGRVEFWMSKVGFDLGFDV